MPRNTEKSGGSVGDFRLGNIIVPIPLTDMRAPAAWKDDLGDAPAAGVLGLTDAPGDVLKGNASNGNAKTDVAQFVFALPLGYQAGGTVTVRIRAKKDTTAATVSDTVDCTAKLIGDTIGADIVTTTPQKVVLTYSDYDFVINPDGLQPGMLLSIAPTTISDDTGGATAKAIWISAVTVRVQMAV